VTHDRLPLYSGSPRVLVNQRMRTFLPTLFIASMACLPACTQEEGERCQRDQDCEPLICVGSSEIGETGESGHCCPACDRGAVPFWEAEEEACACTEPGTDGDTDTDVDSDVDGDTGGDVDGDADGDVNDDGGDSDGDGE